MPRWPWAGREGFCPPGPSVGLRSLPEVGGQPSWTLHHPCPGGRSLTLLAVSTLKTPPVQYGKKSQSGTFAVSTESWGNCGVTEGSWKS